MPLTTEFFADLSAVLVKHNLNKEDLRLLFPAPVPEFSPAPAASLPKSDVDAEWVKATAEAILKANIRLTSNAQSFVAQTFARANQYPTVKFSPKQWEWFNKLMLDAGIEASEVPS